jgi:hypothetical protein
MLIGSIINKSNVWQFIAIKNYFSVKYILRFGIIQLMIEIALTTRNLDIVKIDINILSIYFFVSMELRFFVQNHK